MDKILKAATWIIRNGGVTSLTLEAVAKKAGVSKGRLFYHFPNKDALNCSYGFTTNGYICERDSTKDGLWFNEMLGLAPLKGELRERVLSRLRGATKEEQH